MANTYTLIEAKTLGSAVSSVTFSSIPSTYTDLSLLLSVRSTAAGTVRNMPITFNGSTSNYSERAIQGDGSTAASINRSGSNIGYNYNNGGGSTSSTFSNISIYMPNYAGSNYKSVSIDCANETNATGGILTMTAALWSDTAAINSITLDGDGYNFVQYSTFYLYGISNS